MKSETWGWVRNPANQSMAWKKKITYYEEEKMEDFKIHWVIVLMVVLLMFGIIVDQVRAEDSEELTAVVEFNGYTLEVPEGWEVQLQPKGFNSNPYSDSNPAGKLPGWGGWPLYNYFLTLLNCHPGELVTSPSVCPRQPRFVQPDTQCYFEPQEVPEEECLVISPSTECID